MLDSNTWYLKCPDYDIELHSRILHSILVLSTPKCIDEFNI